MASSSANSSSCWKHDVFLNFRGADTRNNFTSHLHHALCRKGIRTFIDDRLERGKEISLSLLEEIEGSRISLLVFSKDYASSTYCLEELVKILECHESKGQIVVPIFYSVSPDEVDQQTGSFGEAFARHEEEAQSMEDKERVRIWRAALSTASSFSGWHLDKWNEADFIQCIVEEVFIKVNSKVLHVAEYPVGLDSHIEDMNRMLSIGSNGVLMVGICGTGGIGKTTIAKAIFNEFANQFEASSFLLNVRETSKKSGVSQLQETLVFETLGDKICLMGNFDLGINVLRSRLCNKRILIVIDDVDDVEQLRKLAGERNWFGLGSRIIITTRDEHLLISHGVRRVHKVKELCPDDALQLFSWNAFKKPRPEEKYLKLSHCVVKYANGLPLALIVLGSDLFGRSVSEWESELDKLNRIPKRKIFDILKISFEGLEDNEKAIFLDIACFFKGNDKDDVMQMLEACDFHPVSGIQNLIDKSLISIENNRLQMHDLIQSMGRQVVHQESPNVPGKRSRLWFREDVLHVLTEDMGTHKIEGIMLDLPTVEEVYLTAEAFKRMKRLRILVIRNAHIAEGPKYLPNELRWLEWHGCCLDLMPSTFHARNLVAVKMQNSQIRQLGAAFKNFRKLKHIDFQQCEFLTEIPDFSTIPNLERLDLTRCTSLLKIHPSVGFLEKLVFLSFAFCSNLKSLPSCFKLSSLECLRLQGCTKLEELPNTMENMRRLEVLNLRRTAIKELPSSIGFLYELKMLYLSYCKNLTSLPRSIYKLHHLQHLYLEGCPQLRKFPKITENESFSAIASTSSGSSNLSNGHFSLGLYRLTSLQLQNCNISNLEFLENFECFSRLIFLDLSGKNFVSIPSFISRFANLTFLVLSKCLLLRGIPNLPRSLGRLEATDCEPLEQYYQLIPFRVDSYMYSDVVFNFSNCHKLTKSRSVWETQIWLSFIRAKNFEVIVPGSEIPKWFPFQREGNFLGFTLPACICRTITALNLCVVLTRPKDAVECAEVSIEVSVNGFKKISKSRVFSSLGSAHVWLCHFPLEATWSTMKGKPLFSSFAVNCSQINGRLNLKKCGAFLVFEPDIRVGIREPQRKRLSLTHEKKNFKLQSSFMYWP